MFKDFQKIPRLNREMIITEKLDGTNAQILILSDAEVKSSAENVYASISGGPKLESFAIGNYDGAWLFAGSRKRFIFPDDDNFGFARWAESNLYELITRLGYGRHYGEWWGKSIQRKYGMNRKVFSLFNATFWYEHNPPSCCSLVPVLYQGPFSTTVAEEVLSKLKETGSVATKEFNISYDDPEGIIVYHKAGNLLFKATCKDDEFPKGT